MPTELEAAQQIRDGLLPSPWKLGDMALFAIRITGTGASYRDKLKEYVWRDPSLYLNDEFLARCNGLPVVWEHPASGKLDSKEFSKRVVGSVMLPYIRGDEVWGIARIADADAIRLMTNNQLSTSPAVVFSPADGNETLELGGKAFLVEGRPSLLDHVAICARGVWDKSGPPDGVQNDSRKGETMPELDKLLSRLDEVCTKMDGHAKRMDAHSKRMDGAQCRDDAKHFSARRKDDDDDSFKKRHDEEEKDLVERLKKEGEPNEGIADRVKRARKDAEIRRHDADEEPGREPGETMRPAADSRADEQKLRAELYAEQARADRVAQAFGLSADRPLHGENLLDYQRRLARPWKKHSKEFKDVDLDSINDPAALNAVVGRVYADAMQASMAEIQNPGPGRLREMARLDPAGRRIVEFYGDPMSWMQHFMMPPRAVTRFKTPNSA